MSKRENIQEYVLKKGHFDPDLDTSILELVDKLPTQYQLKVKSLT